MFISRIAPDILLSSECESSRFWYVGGLFGRQANPGKLDVYDKTEYGIQTEIYHSFL